MRSFTFGPLPPCLLRHFVKVRTPKTNIEPSINIVHHNIKVRGFKCPTVLQSVRSKSCVLLGILTFHYKGLGLNEMSILVGWKPLTHCVFTQVHFTIGLSRAWNFSQAYSTWMAPWHVRQIQQALSQKRKLRPHRGSLGMSRILSSRIPSQWALACYEFSFVYYHSPSIFHSEHGHCYLA